MKATAFAPGSIGNVGPGFDVLGLAVEGLGDRVTVELTEGDARVESITGRDADFVPRDPLKNAAAIAATAWLRAHGDRRNVIVSLEKGLPMSGGLGGSAASSVGGAFAAALAMDADPNVNEIIAAALQGEMAVAGCHLDNIAPSVYGGLTLARSVRPIDVIALPVFAPWFLALVTPAIRIQTKTAREVLPPTVGNAVWVQQMANTAAVVHAFATGDGALLRRAFDDRFAEPRRAALIPRFNDVKHAAIDAGALGCAISGSGPTLVAICDDEPAAARVCEAMQTAFGDVKSSAHVSPIARRGVREA